MRLRSSVIGTRLGRRLLFLFLLCALLPSASVAVVSFLEVSAELRHQSEVRLRRTTKGLALAVHERLLSLEEGVKLVGDTLPEGRRGRVPEAWPERRFEAVWTLADVGTAKLQLGSDPLGPPALGPAERAAARRGETVVTLDLRHEQPAVVLATRGSATEPIVVASARSAFLFDLTETSSLPPDHDYCIFAASGERLDCSFRDAAALEAAAQALNGPSGFFEWPADEPEHLAAFWALFLDGPFHADNWTFVVSREKASVYKPLAEYSRSFPPFIVAVLCLVALVSISQLRRSLGPLEALREATERVAARDFDARVTIHSRDEFGARLLLAAYYWPT